MRSHEMVPDPSLHPAGSNPLLTSRLGIRSGPCRIFGQGYTIETESQSHCLALLGRNGGSGSLVHLFNTEISQ